MNKKEVEVMFTKEDIKKAISLDYNVDVLDVILDDNEVYSLKEVNKLYKDFIKKGVR
ncbi:MAG: hypothetical protein SOZ22_00155 [Ezakiella sp.]|nr:hypothetical protein [Ezakiella sp.]